jgi:muconolactone delta-isomerase
MLYHVTFNMDRQALIAAGEKVREVRSAEIGRAAAARDAGRLIGFWERADANGVIFILDAESHADLSQELRSLPMFPYVRTIEVVPLIPYPDFPEFATARMKADGAAAP